MAITASLVKELRERTGVGMMECKKALVGTNGDIDAAIELLRKTGAAKADKKSGRVAAEGVIQIKSSDDNKKVVLVEINCETDFVAKDENFLNFCEQVVDTALQTGLQDVEALLGSQIVDDATLDQLRKELIAKIGENIQVRRIAQAAAEGDNGVIGTYNHGGRIGVAVVLEGGDEDLAKDIAMHIAAVKPEYISADDVPAEVIEKEREILTAQAADSGKPAEIIAKMVEGRLRKFLSEITLLGQNFVKNPDLTVEKLLKEKGAKVADYKRLEVGEGIEKKEDNFVEEVMAQARGN
jgi:elongation factor Ts